VRICDEAQGQFVWRAWHRGDATRIAPETPTLLTSKYVSCGACADTCPIGAIEDQSVRQLWLPTNWTRTACTYCGVGCEMMVGTRDNRILQVKPALNAPVNKGHLCVKAGLTLYQFNAGTMTMRTANADLRPTDTLDISREDAGRLGLSDGEEVRVRSRHGEAVLPARISAAVKPGELFATFTDTPEYKVTAVRVENVTTGRDTAG
jgi:predicted molibdopterin-dependent oxidoreductase YjgC